jgi:bifunctional non-homologous end joining protein LigD
LVASVAWPLGLPRCEANTLVCVGRMGTGWDLRRAHSARLRVPCATHGAHGEAAQNARDKTRVEPRIDAEITYGEITDDGVVRHPVFKRLVP